MDVICSECGYVILTEQELAVGAPDRDKDVVLEVKCPKCGKIEEIRPENFKMLKCPECGKRLLDVSIFPKEELQIRTKCPNCRNKVTVKVSSKNQLKKSIPSKRAAL